MNDITLLDAGIPCDGPSGGRHHHMIEVDGRVWTRGDTFHVLDRHGVPRPLTFSYHYTGGAGATVCYSRQRFRRTGDRISVPCGFITMVPSDVAVAMSPVELRVRQLAGDLIDAGRDAAAQALVDSLDGDAGDVEEAERKARAVLDAYDADEIDDLA